MYEPLDIERAPWYRKDCVRKKIDKLFAFYCDKKQTFLYWKIIYLNVKPFLANSILICSITCSGCFSISDFDFCYKLICTVTVLFIIKPESLLIAASLAVKHNLFIIETKTSQTDLKPYFNNQNQTSCSLRITSLTLSLPVAFKVNSSFSISTSVQGMQCLNSENDWGIVALRESPTDSWKTTGSI